MTDNLWARGRAVAAATLSGLGLFFLCLGTVAAQGPAAAPVAPAAGQIWHVAAGTVEGLVGYWKLEQVFDGKTINSAQLSNQSVLSSGTSISSSVPPSVTVPDPGSLQLNGVNGLVVVSDSTQLDVAPAAFSVAAWVKRAANGAYHTIYDSGTETNKWWFFIGANNKIGFANRDVAPEFYSTASITDSKWHHLAVVKNSSASSNLTFYLDGLASGVVTITNVLTPSGTKRIGALLTISHALAAFFNGNLDEVRLYNRALSAAEVGRLAAGRGCVSDGLSWPAAFQDLQCALDVHVAHSGDQIWLGLGTYRPGASSQTTYHLLNGVSLLGGFNGSETSPSQRPAFNPLAPLTGLTGDAFGDDLQGTFGNFADNSCNVVTAGRLSVPGGVSAALDGLVIQDGNANAGAGCDNFPNLASGGGLASVSPNHLTLNNVVFQFNRASSSGGGLLFSSGQLTLTATHFKRNAAIGAGIGGGMVVTGGGLSVDSGVVSITGSSFSNNTASRGGALAVEPGQGHTTLAVSDTSFDQNSAMDGGAVEDQIADGRLDLSFDHATFTRNQSTIGDGGALSNIYFGTASGQVGISASTFTSNTASEDGGAISDFGDRLTISGSQFSANKAPQSAGGALESNASAVTVTSSLFFSNTARNGGAISSFASTLTLVDSQIIQNQGSDPGLASNLAPVGGGVFVDGAALITNTQFLSNTAFLQGTFMDANLAGGGGLAVQGNLSVNGGEFRGNSARQGGGVQVIGSGSIIGSLFQDNIAGEGGGVFVDGDLSLLSSRLISNTALLADATNQPGRGGGVFLQNGGISSRVSNNLFVGNQALSANANAPSGAAMRLDGVITLVSNNTIVSHNLITTSAASVSGTSRLFNNIIATHTVGIEALGGLTFADYNLFSGDTITATGVISSLGHNRVADPHFILAALDDFRLRLDSPALDAGDNSRVPNTVTADLAGGPRFVNVPSVPDTGAGTPPIVDIGAYEVNNQLFLPLVMR